MKKDTVLYEATEPIGDLAEAWGGTLCTPDLSGIVLGWDYSMREFVGFSLLFLFFLLLVFRKSLPEFFRVFFTSMLYRADLQKVEQRALFRVFRSIVVVLLSMLMLGSLSNLRVLPYDPVQGSYLRQLGLVVIFTVTYLLFRRILLWVIGRMTHQERLLSDATALFYPYFCLLVVWLVMAASWGTVLPWVAGVSLFIYLVYLGSLGKAFILSKVSFFFTFLYLCTLEILVPVLWIGICIK